MLQILSPRHLFILIILLVAAGLAAFQPGGIEPHAAQSAAVVLVTLSLWDTALLPPSCLPISPT